MSIVAPGNSLIFVPDEISVFPASPLRSAGSRPLLPAVRDVDAVGASRANEPNVEAPATFHELQTWNAYWLMRGFAAAGATDVASAASKAAATAASRIDPLAGFVILSPPVRFPSVAGGSVQRLGLRINIAVGSRDGTARRERRAEAR